MAKPNALQAAAEVAKSLGKASEPPAEARAPIKATGSKTSREGKRFLGIYVEPRRHEEIKQAAAEEGIQVQELVRQAIDDWMDQYGEEAVRTVAARYERRKKREG